MPSSQSKTRHKKVGKEKSLNCEKKASSSGDSKIHCGRGWEGKSKGQLEDKESLLEQDDTLEEVLLKSQRLVSLQGSKENGHKKLFQGKRTYKRNYKRESGLGRKHGEQLVSKLEGKKRKACKQQEITSGREDEDSSGNEEKATTTSKTHSFKKKCGKYSAVSEKVMESESVKSIAVQSVEGSLQKRDSSQKAPNARHRAKHTENHGFKEASEQKSGSQSQGSMAQGKCERTGKKQVGKHTRIFVTESAEENILETSDNSCSDCSNEGHWTHKKGIKETVVDSTASSEERSSSSEEDGISEKEAMLEDAPVAEGKGSKELLDESNKASNETEREQVTTDGRNESGNEGTDFAGLKAEEKMKKQDGVPRRPKSVLAESNEEDDGVSISGFQLKSLKNRENGNNAKALETNSDLKCIESICSNPATPEILSTRKEPSMVQSFGEKRLNLSNISSFSIITKKPSDKQLLRKKKKVGKVTGNVKLSSGQTLEAKQEKAEVVAEAPSDKENVRDGKGSKYLRTHSAFRKVTSWLGQKPAKKVSLKARLLSVARAIGISRWLLKKFGKRKRGSKPFRFRSRVAIRIVSTAGWVGRSGKAFPGAARQLREAELSDKELSSPLGEGKGGPKVAEEVGRIDLPSGDSPLHGTSSFPYLLSLDEENNDTKFAIVFPRVHSVVKTKSNLSRGSGNGYSLEKLRSLSGRKPVLPVQQGRRFKCDLPKSLMDQSPQRSSEQGFLPHQEEDPIRTSDYSSEIDAKEGSDVLQTAGSIVTPCVHWSQQQAQECDPAAWLNSELLLPRLTIENLSKWAIYKDPYLANSHVMKVCEDQWEAEDITDNVLEMESMQKQVYMCEDHCVEVEEIEDLTRLEYVLSVTYIGQILISVNPFKDLSIYSEDVATQYHQGTLSKNAPHIFAIAEMAYTLSQSSEQEQCVIISGHSGSGKTEATKAIVQYLTMLYQRSDNHRIRQPCNVLPILESFGNARTILNDNSSRFGKLLNVHLRHGIVVGTSISQYLLEKSRVVFQAHGERNYHVFYELLAGLPVEQKEEMYLQEAESYFYLNQGRACDILGKEDSQDFLVLVQALEGINLSDDQLTSTWAVLAAILQLGNICFTSYEKETYEHAAIASDTEIQIVANLLRVSADFLQSAVTHRVTVTSYDRIFTPLSVEGAIDARDSIAKTLYYLLFEWLLLRINEWLAPCESDCAVGIVDIHGFEVAFPILLDLGVNSLEQLCINFANEHLQHFFSQTVIAQEEATDHTFLQKCHYHHGNSPWYTKPKLPLPVFTVKHYAGPVTYQVHKFLNKNRDQLRPEVLDIFSQSRLKVVSHIFQKAKAAYIQQRELGARGKGLKPQASTLVSKFQQSLQDLTDKLRRSHAFFIRCITPNPKKLSNIFDVEYVTCQLRHSGILEAIHIRKEGYPVRLPFQNFLARYGLLAGRERNCLEEREGCAAVLSHVVGNPSDLYQIGVTKVFLKEKARQLLERQWNQRQSWAIVTLQRNFRCLLRRRRLRILQEKVTIIQAHFRGYQEALQETEEDFGAISYHDFNLQTFNSKEEALPGDNTLLRIRCTAGAISALGGAGDWLELEEKKRRRRSLVSGDTENGPNQRMDVGLLEIPAELAALLQVAEDQYRAQSNQITEALPPEVKVKDDLSLPPTINSYPFSSFIKSYFQKTDFPAPGQPLQQPLTRLDAEYQESALEINKLVREVFLDQGLVEEQILRFIGDKNLHGWQEILLGNYIAGRGLNNVPLRNEIFSQVVAQTWKNPDMEHSQRAWVLMATLLSCFAPSPALEKPLLKFVSDHGMEGYNAVCQRKILTAAQHTEIDATSSRAYPPTQLEWTANQRRGKMVLDVHTFNEEKFSAEVESWMTGEQYAAWLLSARGCDKKSRGWSISMFTGNTWQDLLGCDFVLDLIGEMEETSNLNNTSQSSAEYPISPERDRSFLQSSDLDSIPPAPGIQAPTFPPPGLPPEFHNLHPGPRFRDDLRAPVGLDHYVDDLFSTVLHQGSRVPDMENRESLTGRMKGGGKIGPTQRGIFPSTGFSGMTQAPVYQSMPSMMGMPAAMPMMPAAGGIAPMPAMIMPQPVVPAVDPNQLAAQQQAFINQQAMLMAQQMTLQAMSISQQQQQQLQPGQWQQSLENSRPRVSSLPQAQAPALVSAPVRATSPKPKKPPSSQNAAPPPKAPELPAKAEEQLYDYTEDQFSDSEDGDYPRETFQQKREYFQRMGYEQIRVKKVRLPPKTWTPPANPQPKQEEEKEEKREKRNEENPSPKPEAACAPPLPPPEPKPKKQTPKVKKEPPVVKPSGPESRPAPSREIHNIIKMYQSRPGPEPQPVEPVRRVSKPFMKKNDPKNEALAKLGMMNLPSPKSPCPPPEEKRTPPPPKPKPGSASSSIKEKQLPLLSIFSGESTPPGSPAAPAPPLPPPLPSPPLLRNQDRQEPTEKGSTVTVAEDDGIKTQLYKLTASVTFSYVNPVWKIFLRKEVFYPKENFSHPYCLNLLCEQIMRDTFSDSCLRISREEKRKMKDLLMEFRVGNDVQSIQEDGIKKRIVLAARDNWANYFSRLFPVHGENGSDVQILGVSHRGMRLLKVVKAAGYNPEHLKILRSYSFADVLSVELKGSNALEFSLKTEQLFLHSPKAPCIKAMVELFIQELKQDTNYVIALRSYIVDDKSLLSFKKGDLIELLPMQGVEPGWQFGSTGGRCGIFPTSLVQLAAAPDYLSTSMDRHEGLRKSMKASPESRNTSRKSSVPSLTSEPDSIVSIPAGNHYTMIDFAMAYFREAQSMQRLRRNSAEKKSVAALVQHTKVPIQESLLQYSDSELNELATKNFKTLMRFMGDHSKLKNQNEVECISEILQLCKEKESLHDEVYCQVIKQVTQNPNQEGTLRGWLLLNLLTGYFLPSNILMPYATKFLQLASSDPSSTHHDIAKTCQSNLRKNFMYGGRRHLPFPVEIEALLISKELLQEICEHMGAGEQEEIEEFVLFAIRSDNNNLDKTVRPIRSEEYLHDYLLEDTSVSVTLRRLIWRTPLHFENKIYTDAHYGQMLWDYLNGRILLSHNKEMEMQVAILAMLQHWAKTEQQNSVPSSWAKSELVSACWHREELKEYTPQTLQFSISPQALQNHVDVLLRTRRSLQPVDAKIQFIEHVMKLPFFGYTTYFVERVSDNTIPVPCFFGVNKEEIIVVDSTTQVVFCTIPLKELQKMRTLWPISDGGLPGIELNYGSAASPKTMWLELPQAKEMYHTIVVILDATELHR
ncbi:PREDICTED: unconventional myosin-XV-like [Tauraco erythrolophus]|uniref:unconventional myosin-XV-like n=1 Tax=Tauraco erythrolophus TaxID=121530 RepID=UPI0005234F6D|nr:PREDICTED: unconventional myosin-XV-like [Tauraco erythrolophus]